MKEMEDKKNYEGAEPLKRRAVECHKCKHKWTTISDLHKVTCPSCSTKTDRIKYKQAELKNE